MIIVNQDKDAILNFDNIQVIRVFEEDCAYEITAFISEKDVKMKASKEFGDVNIT